MAQPGARPPATRRWERGAKRESSPCRCSTRTTSRDTGRRRCSSARTISQRRPTGSAISRERLVSGTLDAPRGPRRDHLEAGRPLAAGPHAGRGPQHPAAGALRAAARARRRRGPSSSTRPSRSPSAFRRRESSQFINGILDGVLKARPAEAPAHEGLARRSASRCRAGARARRGVRRRRDELAVYRASGAEAGLFDQYDNDGYSLGVARRADGSLELSVRVSGAPLASAARRFRRGRRATLR